VTRFKVNDDERDLLLAGLFELRVARAEDEELGERIVALVERLGGDRYAVGQREFLAYVDRSQPAATSGPSELGTADE
jgi:hypothetical protein